MDEKTALVLERARRLGADLAGVAAVEDLRRADDVVWPEEARSVIVVALAHPVDKPEMDWWFGRTDPPGNRSLAHIVEDICAWVGRDWGITVRHMPYHVERGGIYLKDAAVFAGLGRIGLNNLLVTPEYGPRVRLRALTVNADLTPTGPSGFDPCAGCDAPCRQACPQGAFSQDGIFHRAACAVQMDADVDAGSEQSVPGFFEPVRIIRYCRACELSCRVGA